MKLFLQRFSYILTFIVTAAVTAFGQFAVSSTSPTKNAIDVAANTNITITFNQDANAANIIDNSNLIVTGSMSGRHSFTKSYNAGTFTLTVDPNNDFLPGEIVTFKIMYGIQDQANTTALGVSKQYSFTVASGGTGQGYFTSGDYFTGSINNNTVRIYPVDFDKDGDIDIASFRSMVSNSNYIDLARKNIANSYTNETALQYSGGYNMKSLAFSDINRDQYIDIVAFAAPGGTDITTASVIINNSGTLNPPSSTISPNATFNTTNTTGGLVADVNMDGYDDFVMVNKGLTGAVPFYSSSGTSFSQGNSTLLANTTTGNWLTADLNNDGYPDFIGSSGPTDAANKDTVGVLLSTGSNSYAAKSIYRTLTGSTILSLAVGDVDGDGDIDIIAADNSYSNNLTIFWNNGSGVFSSKTTTSLPTRAFDLKVGDMDGDGDLDIVFREGGNFYVSFNNGSGAFNSTVTYTTSTAPVDLALCDADGDGDLDVVILDTNNSLIKVYYNSVVTAPTSSGGSTFNLTTDHGSEITVSISAGDGGRRIVVLKSGSAVSATPSDNTTYTANSAFGTGGSDLGGGNYVVYNGSGTSGISITGLTLGGTYHWAVYEYNGPNGIEKYRTTSPATGNFTASTTPNGATVNAFSKNYGSTVQVNWSNGSGVKRIVVMKQGSAVSATPTNNTTYSANAAFGSGDNMGGGNYVVYNGTGSSVNVTGLSLNTTYHVSVFEYFGTAGSETYGTSFEPGSEPVGNVTTSATAGYPFGTTAGSALSYNADHWDYADNSITLGSAFTIEAWVKPSAIGSNMVIVLHDNNYLWIGIDASGRFYGRLRDDDLEDDVLITGATTTAVANQWYHVALTAANGSKLKLYVNGALEVESAGNIGTISTSSGSLWLGGDWNSSTYRGQVDEFRHWGDVRTASEIRLNMHKTLSGFPPDLLSYWQLNEGSGTESVELVSGNTFYSDDDFVWVTSTAPVGGGSAATSSVAANTTGTQTIGNVSLNMSDGFDDPTDVVISEVTAAPSSFPTNYSSSVGSKYFIIDAFPYPANGTFSTSLTLNYGTGVLTDANAANYILYKRASASSGTWTSFGGATSVNTTTGAVTWSNITSFSQAVVVNQNDALPVELTSFTANTAKGSVELLWKTATEVNNAGFDIERSAVDEKGSNNTSWKKIGSVDGHGTTNAPQAYSFIDKTARGTLNYRLKQIDRDGKFTYSQTVEVTTVAPTVFALSQNYPNPFNPSTTIEFTLQTSGLTSLKVYDAIGREVATLVNEVLEAGVYHQRTFDASRLTSGVYFARLTSSGKVQIKKMLLMK
ncbi:MAG: FG-GAP-like repeat-containing protein [Bacteroidota bacterium]